MIAFILAGVWFIVHLFFVMFVIYQNIKFSDSFEDEFNIDYEIARLFETIEDLEVDLKI